MPTQYIARDELFIRGRQPSEYIHKGETVELDEAKAKPLLDKKLIEPAGETGAPTAEAPAPPPTTPPPAEATPPPAETPPPA